jgi:phosphoesterase RecJ-like protein
MKKHAELGANFEPSKVFLELLMKHERFLVLGHQHPDGDALGSASALAMILRSMGKSAQVGISGRLAPNLSFLMEPPKYFSDITEPDIRYLRGFELLVYVDCHGPTRVWPEKDAELYSELPPNLVIDHHIHNEELQGALSVFHDKFASSTGELIMRLARNLSVNLSPKAVEALLTAIVSDTGFFTQENTTPHTLMEASDLVAMGGKLARLYEKLNSGYSISRMRLLKNSLESLDVFLGGRVAVMLLSTSMLEEAGARVEEADGFIEYPRSLSNVFLSALIKDDGKGGIKVSLRSKPPVSARKIAQRFGGGGHELAAAYTDHVETIELARDRFLEVAAQYILGD